MNTLTLPRPKRPALQWLPPAMESSTMNRISVFVVDDHAIFRRGMAVAVASDAALSWCGEAGNAAEALRIAPMLRPDVLMLDMVMSGTDCVHLLKQLRSLLPQTRFVAISCSMDTGTAKAALEAGVSAFVLKTASPQELTLALAGAFQGRRHVAEEMAVALRACENQTAPGADLTRRERGLLELMAQGMSNHDIAQALDIGLPTVKFHVTNILSKLQVENRTAAVLTALRYRLVVMEV